MLGIIALLVIVCCIYWLYRNRGATSGSHAQWTKPFAIRYINEVLSLYATGSDPMPEEAARLLEHRLDGAAQQSLIVSLGNYLREHCGRNVQRGDYELAVKCVRDLLSGEVRRANSFETLPSYIRTMHRNDTGEEISEDQLAAYYEEIVADVKSDELAAALTLGNVLRFNIEAMHVSTFGLSYWDYVKGKASSTRARPPTSGSTSLNISAR
ncbi:hypothetical protein HFO04_01045 [Rhizobium laguerreae]|uniref:hypothetical protein n=1 Tax=Rhizobium laguerreae TaxID=1076926 RepID=UPI001C92494D|nr:hypothetical protein [Rhizobium laguerreae]MBY3301398.1 hypothetical protein [Rhizobium laguerreae]